MLLYGYIISLASCCLNQPPIVEYCAEHFALALQVHALPSLPAMCLWRLTCVD